jgi:hypothetical protein
MLKKLLLLASLMMLLSGCGKVLLIRPGTTMVLAGQVKADVYAPDEDGTLVRKSVTLPPGTLLKHRPEAPDDPPETKKDSVLQRL